MFTLLHYVDANKLLSANWVLCCFKQLGTASKYHGKVAYQFLVKCILEIPSLQMNMCACSSLEKTPSNPEYSVVIREWIVAC